MFFPGENFESEDDSESSLKFSNDGFNFKRFDRSTKSKLGRRQTARASNLKTPKSTASTSSEPLRLSDAKVVSDSVGLNVKTDVDQVDSARAHLLRTSLEEKSSRPNDQLAKPFIFDTDSGRVNSTFGGHDSSLGAKISVNNESSGPRDNSFGNDSTFLTAIDMNIEQMSKAPERSLFHLSVLDSPIDLLSGLSDDESGPMSTIVLKPKQSPTKTKIPEEYKENYRPPLSNSSFQTPVRMDRYAGLGVRQLRPLSGMQDPFKNPNQAGETPRTLTQLHSEACLRSEPKRERSLLRSIPEKNGEFTGVSWPNQMSITTGFKQLSPPQIDINEKTCCCNCHKSVSSQGILGVKQENMITIKDTTYTVLSLLGKGGSSVVYLVMGPDNPDGLAVKCVNLGTVEKTVAEGHLKEIEALDRLQDCSTVIKMFAHEYVEKTKMLYVVMEKGDIDLSKLIKNITKTRKLPVSMILSYWEEMLAAVKDIHDRGIIHSDLKPANFLLVEGRLKLIDFGIASTLNGDMTSIVRDNIAGTFHYMSPEAIRNAKISYKSDVWSLGCILYNLLYGRTPFAHLPNNWSRLQSIGDLKQKVEFPENADEAPHPILGLAVRMCLEKDPKERPTVQKLIRLSQLSIPRHHPLAQANYNYYANEVAKLDV